MEAVEAHPSVSTLKQCCVTVAVVGVKRALLKLVLHASRRPDFLVDPDAVLADESVQGETAALRCAHLLHLHLVLRHIVTDGLLWCHADRLGDTHNLRLPARSVRCVRPLVSRRAVQLADPCCVEHLLVYVHAVVTVAVCETAEERLHKRSALSVSRHVHTVQQMVAVTAHRHNRLAEAVSRQVTEHIQGFPMSLLQLSVRRIHACWSLRI